MSGETTMYALKPVVSLPGTLHRARTMYEMRNIHEEEGRAARDDHTEEKTVPDIAEQVTSFLESPSPEFVALEARQEKILVQLGELKQQVSTLRDFLKQTNQAALVNNCESQVMSSTDDEPVNAKVIINANPKRPPYFLLALQKVWNDVDIRVQTYVHSSVTGEVPSGYGAKDGSPKDNVINVHLIWKNVEDLEMITGLESYPLRGDANFLRYASRLINAHNYELLSAEQVQIIDTVLDLCHCLAFEEAQKRKQEILASMGGKLNCEWAGGRPSLADIAAWSTIKQAPASKCPTKLNKWFETCEKRFL